jgi:uncharacterized protein YraI
MVVNASDHKGIDMVQKHLLLSATFGALAIAVTAMSSPVWAQATPAQAPPATQAPGAPPPAVAPAPLPQLAPQPPAGPPPAAAEPQTAYVTSNVNLRSGPGTDAPVLATIPAGSAVRVSNCTLEWCAVEWNGREGYSIARNLSPNKPRLVRRYVARPYYPPAPPPAVYGPSIYYPPPPVYYRPYYYGPRYYYGRGWGRRYRW